MIFNFFHIYHNTDLYIQEEVIRRPITKKSSLTLSSTCTSSKDESSTERPLTAPSELSGLTITSHKHQIRTVHTNESTICSKLQ